MSDTVSDLVIETHGLHKEFRGRRGRRRVAVQDLDLAVVRGGVHGFLGPNGSGKTTTIRLLLGLSRPTHGDMRLLGEPVPHHLPDVMGRIGAVVEEPKFFPSFTGHRNLSLLARAAGLPQDRVDSALERVDMTSRGQDRYKTYSLGMRQRLAIAATLLKEPVLLILDEPTNGLDPAGIRDIRALIRELGDSGVTVLLSSHILAEVQQVCDSVSIIGNGRLLSAGRVDDMVGKEQAGARLRVGVTDPGAALRRLREAGHEAVQEDHHLMVTGIADPADITRLLASHDIWVRELSSEQLGLEDVFLRITDSEALGHDPGPDPGGDGGHKARGEDR